MPTVRKVEFPDRGAVIGRYLDRQIYDFITDASGNAYYFDRIAIRDSRGGCDLNQLSDGEVMAAPGVIYSRRGGQTCPRKAAQK